MLDQMREVSAYSLGNSESTKKNGEGLISSKIPCNRILQ